MNVNGAIGANSANLCVAVQAGITVSDATSWTGNATMVATEIILVLIVSPLVILIVLLTRKIAIRILESALCHHAIRKLESALVAQITLI